MTPIAVSVDEDTEAFLCQCKSTGNPPYCDGSHTKLGSAKPGDVAPQAQSDGPPKATPTPEEPTVARIHAMARDGLTKTGHHGEMGAMGVPLTELPRWDDIQFVTAQFATKPLMDDAAVGTDAQLAGTSICSGEGGMLPEEQAENSRYFYELASAEFGWDLSLVEQVQAFHFKGGQGAKTGTGGHLPGNKVTEKIAAVRGLEVGEDAISPPTFGSMKSAKDFRKLADEVRERSGGIPIGFKLSAQHIEDDIDFALDASADYIILDGRGGGTGAAPLLFRNNISVPTIPALARARRHLDKRSGRDVTLIITGGLRVPEDFAKAMAMGADGIAISNSALHAVGCIAARMCNTNNCPAGIATQKPELRALLDVDAAATRLATFFDTSVQLMQILARACGHDHLSMLTQSDLTTWKKGMSRLSGITFGGVG